MIKNTQQRAQAIMLNLLEQFDEYCTKHSLRYTLVWGALIGAVRHQGFIPWDNDIDIAMPRSDYQRLLTLVQNEPIDDLTELINWRTDSQFLYSISRVISKAHPIHIPYLKRQPKHMSPWLDIFPFDRVPPPSDTPIQRKDLPYLMRLAHTMQGPLMYDYPLTSTSNILKLVLGSLVYPLKSQLLTHIDRSAQQYANNHRSSQTYTCLVERCGRLTFIDEQSFSNPTYLPFEHLLLPVMNNYHEWLTDYYGDYLTLPPVDQREVHEFHFVDRASPITQPQVKQGTSSTCTTG